MLALILKSLMRALLIFFPVAYLSFGQSTSNIPVGTGVVLLLVLSLCLILVSWARITIRSRKDEAETRSFKAGEQNH